MRISFQSVFATTSVELLTQTSPNLGIKATLLPFTPESLEKIHRANKVNASKALNQRPGAGHTLLVGDAIAVTEIQGYRNEQQDSASIHRLHNFPKDIEDAKDQITQQIAGVNHYLKTKWPIRSWESGTTYERVIVDTRASDKVRVITAKAGDGDVYLVTEEKGQLKVTQADWRDKPDATEETQRITRLGGKIYLPQNPQHPARIIAPTGNMSVSAACGDFGNPYMRHTARIQTYDYPRQGDGQLQKILINCDGLTEPYENDSFIAETLNNLGSQDVSSERVAKQFAAQAYRKGSNDNISVGAINVKKLLEMEPGVYEIIICDGHGKDGRLISKAVCEYHCNTFAKDVIKHKNYESIVKQQQERLFIESEKRTITASQIISDLPKFMYLSKHHRTKLRALLESVVTQPLITGSKLPPAIIIKCLVEKIQAAMNTKRTWTEFFRRTYNPINISEKSLLQAVKEKEENQKQEGPSP